MLISGYQIYFRWSGVRGFKCRVLGIGHFMISLMKGHPFPGCFYLVIAHQHTLMGIHRMGSFYKSPTVLWIFLFLKTSHWMHYLIIWFGMCSFSTRIYLVISFMKTSNIQWWIIRTNALDEEVPSKSIKTIEYLTYQQHFYYMQVKHFGKRQVYQQQFLLMLPYHIMQ